MADNKQAPELTKLEVIEQRRAARRKKTDDKREEQELVDLEAIDAMESEADENLATMTINRFVPGMPVKIAFRPPTDLEYKRFDSQLRKAGKNEDGRKHAQDTLVQSCWVYPPDPEVRKALLAAVPGLLNSIAVEIAKLVEAHAEDTKKG